MDPYITLDEYNQHTSQSLSRDEFMRKVAKAQRAIDGLTFNRIVAIGFNNLTAFQQEIIKETLILQIDYLESIGSMGDFPVSGYSAGGTSVQFENGALYKFNGINTTTTIVDYLKQTGLMVKIV